MPALTNKQFSTLAAFARFGDFLVPKEKSLVARCKKLTTLKLLRPMPFLDGSKRPGDKIAIGVAYKITPEGRRIAGV